MGFKCQQTNLISLRFMNKLGGLRSGQPSATEVMPASMVQARRRRSIISLSAYLRPAFGEVIGEAACGLHVAEIQILSSTRESGAVRDGCYYSHVYRYRCICTALTDLRIYVRLADCNCKAAPSTQSTITRRARSLREQRSHVETQSVKHRTHACPGVRLACGRCLQP